MVITDSNSSRCYLYAGESTGAKLHAFEMASDRNRFAKEVIVETPPQFAEGAFRQSHGGHDYLSCSQGGWQQSSDSVHYVMGDSPTGPWTYQGSCLTSDATSKGPGHHSLFQDPRSSEWHIAYDGWEKQEVGGPYQGMRSNLYRSTWIRSGWSDEACGPDRRSPGRSLISHSESKSHPTAFCDKDRQTACHTEREQPQAK